MPILDVSDEEVKAAEEASASEYVNFQDGDWTAKQVECTSLTSDGTPVLIFHQFKEAMVARIRFKVTDGPATAPEGPPGNYTLSELAMLAATYKIPTKSLPTKPDGTSPSENAQYINRIIQLINESGNTIKIRTSKGWVKFVFGMDLPAGKFVFYLRGVTSRVDNRPCWTNPNAKAGGGKDLTRKTFTIGLQLVGQVTSMPNDVEPPKHYRFLTEIGDFKLYITPSPFAGYREQVWVDYALEYDPNTDQHKWAVKPKKGGLTNAAIRHRHVVKTVCPEVISRPFANPNNICPEMHAAMIAKPTFVVVDRVLEENRVNTLIRTLSVVEGADILNYAETVLGFKMQPGNGASNGNGTAVTVTEPEPAPDMFGDDDEEGPVLEIKPAKVSDTIKDVRKALIDRMPNQVQKVLYVLFHQFPGRIELVFGGPIGPEVKLQEEVKQFFRSFAASLSCGVILDFNENDVSIVLDAMKTQFSDDQGLGMTIDAWNFAQLESAGGKPNVPSDFYAVLTGDETLLPKEKQSNF